MKRATSVDDYIHNSDHWQLELQKLRNILLTTELEECIKWGGPCYTIGSKNVVGLGAFKSYFGLWFHQGALLEDKNRKLINAQEGKTKALRQWRMTNANEIQPAVIRRYLKEAIANAKSGREIKVDRTAPLVLPVELKKALSQDAKIKQAFYTLGKGLQREYALYISEAKRDDTRHRRLDKIRPMILQGIGLNDRYR